MEVLGIVTDIAVALLTGALALAAFLEIRQSQAARRRDYFNSELGRLLELEGSDFLFGMRFSLDSWQQDRDLGRVIDEMRRNYAGRREQFRELALSLRPALVTHREALVQAHPETDDGGHIGQYLVGLDDHLSLRRFDELAKGAELELNDPRFVLTDTAYNSPPGREPPERSLPPRRACWRYCTGATTPWRNRRRYTVGDWTPH